MPRPAKQKDGRIGSQQVHLLSTKCFEINILKRNIKVFADCEDITTRYTRMLLMGDEFRRHLLRGGIAKQNGFSTLCNVYMTDMLWDMLNIAEKMIFCSVRRIGIALSRAASPSMTSKYIRRYYEEVEKEVMPSRNSGNICIENSDANAKELVGFAHLFCDETFTTLKSTTLVAYSCMLFS